MKVQNRWKMENNRISEPRGLRMLCPFCGEEQDLETVEEFEQSLRSCPSGGIYENEIDYKIVIRCCKCKRVIYVKEGNKDFDD